MVVFGRRVLVVVVVVGFLVVVGRMVVVGRLVVVVVFFTTMFEVEAVMA